MTVALRLVAAALLAVVLQGCALLERNGREAAAAPAPGLRQLVPFAALSISAISSRMNDRRVQELATTLRNESRLIERQIANGMEIR